MSFRGGAVRMRTWASPSSSRIRCISSGSGSAIAMMSTWARSRRSTAGRSVRFPATGTELMRRCFLAGSSSMIATGRYGESLSCSIWVIRVLPRKPAPYTTACGACSLGLDLDSTYIRLR